MDSRVILGLLGALATCCTSTTSGSQIPVDVPRLGDVRNDLQLDAVVIDVGFEATDRPEAVDAQHDPRCDGGTCRPTSQLHRRGSGGIVVLRPDGSLHALNPQRGDREFALGGPDRDLIQWTPEATLNRRGEVTIDARNALLLGVSPIIYRGAGLSIFSRSGGAFIVEQGILRSFPSLSLQTPPGVLARSVLTMDYRFALPVVDVIDGTDNAIVLLSDGSLHYMRLYSEELPHRSRDDAGVVAPTRIQIPGEVKRVVSFGDAGESGGVILRDGSLLYWGRAGEFSGLTLADPAARFSGVVELRDVENLSADGRSACAVTRQGSVFCWGNSHRGELGIGVVDLGSQEIRHPVGPRVELPPIRDVIVSERRVCALAMDERVFCWGDFRLGRVGDPDYAPFQATPVEMIVPP